MENVYSYFLKHCNSFFNHNCSNLVDYTNYLPQFIVSMMAVAIVWLVIVGLMFNFCYLFYKYFVNLVSYFKISNYKKGVAKPGKFFTIIRDTLLIGIGACLVVWYWHY